MLPDGYRYYESHYEDVRVGFEKEGMYFLPIGKNAKDGYAIVDPTDCYAENYKWRLDSHGYPITTVFNQNGVRTNLGLHHFIIGKPHKGFVVDHINRNTLDCRKSNLRIVSHAMNSFNRRQNPKSKNPYPGVKRQKGRWTAEIRKNGDYEYLGSFIELSDAIEARRQAERRLFGEVSVRKERSRYGN